MILFLIGISSFIIGGICLGVGQRSCVQAEEETGPALLRNFSEDEEDAISSEDDDS